MYWATLFIHVLWISILIGRRLLDGRARYRNQTFQYDLLQSVILLRPLCLNLLPALIFKDQNAIYS